MSGNGPISSADLAVDASNASSSPLSASSSASYPTSSSSSCPSSSSAAASSAPANQKYIKPNEKIENIIDAKYQIIEILKMYCDPTHKGWNDVKDEYHLLNFYRREELLKAIKDISDNKEIETNIEKIRDFVINQLAPRFVLENSGEVITTFKEKNADEFNVGFLPELLIEVAKRFPTQTELDYFAIVEERVKAGHSVVVRTYGEPKSQPPTGAARAPQLVSAAAAYERSRLTSEQIIQRGLYLKYSPYEKPIPSGTDFFTIVNSIEILIECERDKQLALEEAKRKKVKATDEGQPAQAQSRISNTELLEDLLTHIRKSNSLSELKKYIMDYRRDLFECKMDELACILHLRFELEVRDDRPPVNVKALTQKEAEKYIATISALQEKHQLALHEKNTIIATLKKSMDDLLAELDHAKQEPDALRGQIEALQVQLRELTLNKAKLQEDIRDLEISAEQLRKIADEHEREKQRALSAIPSLTEAFSLAKANLSEKLEKASAHIHKLEEASGETNMQKQQAIEAAHRLELEKAKFKEQRDHARGEVVKLQHVVSVQEEHVAQLNKRVGSLEAEIAELNKKMAEMKLSARPVDIPGIGRPVTTSFGLRLEADSHALRIDSPPPSPRAKAV